MSRNKKYKMKAISSSFSEKGGYSAQFVSDGYSVDARAEILPGIIRSNGIQVGEGTAWELIESFLMACAQRAASTGETVTVGSLITFGLAIRGWFANKDSKASKENVRVTANLLGDLRPTVAFSMSNDIDGLTLTLYTVMSGGCALGHVRQAAAFRINGKHLQMLKGDRLSACAKNAKGETVEAECTVIESADDHIDALLPAPFNDKTLVNSEIVFKVEGRCGDPLAGTQTKTIAATLDDNDVPAPVVTKYINQGMEAEVTEANEIFAVGGDAIFTGSNLAGAAVRAVSINGDKSVDIDTEHVTASDSELRISHNAHSALFGTFGNGADIHVEIMTPGGTARVKCRLVNDTVAG